MEQRKAAREEQSTVADVFGRTALTLYLPDPSRPFFPQGW